MYSLQYHIVWCVKYRHEVITEQIENRLIEILNKIAERVNESSSQLTAKIKELSTKPFAFQVLVFSMTLVFLIAANIVMLITKSSLQFLWELMILFFIAVIISAYGIVGLRKAESKWLYTTKLCARFVCLEIVLIFFLKI